MLTLGSAGSLYTVQIYILILSKFCNRRARIYIWITEIYMKIEFVMIASMDNAVSLILNYHCWIFYILSQNTLRTVNSY